MTPTQLKPGEAYDSKRVVDYCKQWERHFASKVKYATGRRNRDRRKQYQTVQNRYRALGVKVRLSADENFLVYDAKSPRS